MAGRRRARGASPPCSSAPWAVTCSPRRRRNSTRPRASARGSSRKAEASPPAPPPSSSTPGAAQNEIVVALRASAQLRPRDVDPRPDPRGEDRGLRQHEANLEINTHVFPPRPQGAATTTVLNPAPMRGDFDRFGAAARRRADSQRDRIRRPRQPAGGRRPHRERAQFRSSHEDFQRLCRAPPGPHGHRHPRQTRLALSPHGADGFTFIPAHTGRLNVVDTTGAGDAFCRRLRRGLRAVRR